TGPLINEFVTVSLLILVMVGSAVGLGYLGLRLVHFDPPHGLRGGIFVAAVGLAGIATVTWGVGRILEAILSYWEGTQPIGAILTAATGLGLLFLAGRWFLRPQTEEVLTQIEDQGW